MSNLEDYKVEHLFLLVGENPLPNYVAARTLLKNGGKVYLVFTKQTQSQKDCLRGDDGLKHFGIQCVEVELGNYESNAYHIRDRIQKKAKSLSGSIGLNYTGGTKAMSVHAYRALLEIKPDSVFSYLDARTLKMYIDRQGNEPIRFDVPLELSLGELFKLHNQNYWLEEKPPRSQPVLPDAAAQFAEFHATENWAREWRTWCNKQLHPQTKNGQSWKSEEELKRLPPLNLGGLSDTIIDELRSYLDASDRELSLNVTQKKEFDNLTQVCEWLDGTWMESYVLQQVQKIQDKYKIKESLMSFHIRDTENPRRERFEFDVAFIKGYQLFAISCTTSRIKYLCKEKLFEAHFRARELGGDEARVALVCCFDNPDRIKNDIRLAIPDKKIAVFGRSDLANLAKGIANWIDRNNQEARA